MNYVPIHTNVYPNYNYLSAENSFLRQTIEYKDAVLCDQQGTIAALRRDIDQLSQANMRLKAEQEKVAADAERWRVMKQIIRIQGNDQQLYTVEKIIDKDLELERRRAARVERGDGCSAGATPHPPASQDRRGSVHAPSDRAQV